MISAGARVVCFAVANPGRDIFLDMPVGATQAR